MDRRLWIRSLGAIVCVALLTVGFVAGLVLGVRSVPPDIPVAQGVAVAPPATAAATGPRPFVVDETIATPYGPLRVQSDVTDLYPKWRLREQFMRSGRAQRLKALKQIEMSAKATAFESALTRGVFHPVTTAIGSVERFIESPLIDAMPAPFRLPRKWSRPLTIQIFGQAEHLKDSTSFEMGGVPRNAVYHRETHTIAVSIDPVLLDYYFPASPFAATTWNDAGEAWVMLRRTAMKPLYHELAHALQTEAGRGFWRNPALAEGQAEYLAGSIEREEILAPFIANELIARISAGEVTSPGSLERETKMRVADLRTGRVLQPFEYARVARVLAHVTGTPRLHSLIARSGDTFALESAQDDYDLAWAFFHFLTQDNNATVADRIVEFLEALEIEQQGEELARIEKRMIASLRQMSQVPMGMKAFDAEFAPIIHEHDRRWRRKEYWEGYRVLAQLVALRPREPILWAYLGDAFLAQGERDMFFTYYDLARKERNEGTQMSGNVRVVNRYASALWDIGHLQRAFDTQREYTVTSLDIMAVMEMSLRREFMVQANAARWEPQALSRLHTEYELGNSLMVLSSVADTFEIEQLRRDPTVTPEYLAEMEAMRSMVTDGMRRQVKTLSFQLGYRDGVIPAGSWFLLDFHLVKRPLDLKALCLTARDACPASKTTQDHREPAPGTEGESGERGEATAEVTTGATRPVDQADVSARDWFMRGQFATTPHDKIAAYSRALERAPRDLPSLMNRCLAYRDAAEYSAAIADCERAVALAPLTPEAHNNLGWAYDGLGEHDKAIASYTRALQLQPRYRLARMNRADSYVASRRLREAVADREELLRLYPGEASSYNGLAWVLIDQQVDVDRGIEYAKKAVALRPKDANMLDTLGWGYFHMKRYDEAVSWLTKAAQFDPANSEIQQHLEAARRQRAERPPK